MRRYQALVRSVIIIPEKKITAPVNMSWGGGSSPHFITPPSYSLYLSRASLSLYHHRRRHQLLLIYCHHRHYYYLTTINEKTVREEKRLRMHGAPAANQIKGVCARVFIILSLAPPSQQQQQQVPPSTSTIHLIISYPDTWRRRIKNDWRCRWRRRNAYFSFVCFFIIISIIIYFINHTMQHHRVGLFIY